MAKINTWILYRRHFRQNGKLHKDQKSLLQFSLELWDALNLANKINLSTSRGQPSRRRSLKAPTTGKKSTQALPVTDDYQQNSMRIMQNAMFQIQDLYLFTGWSQLLRWFTYKIVDKYLHIFYIFPNRKVLVSF